MNIKGVKKMDVFMIYLWKVILAVCFLNGIFTFIVGGKDFGTAGFSLNMFLMGIVPYRLFLHFVENGIFNVITSSLISFLLLLIICFAGTCLFVEILKWQEVFYD